MTYISDCKFLQFVVYQVQNMGKKMAPCFVLKIVTDIGEPLGMMMGSDKIHCIFWIWGKTKFKKWVIQKCEFFGGSGMPLKSFPWVGFEEKSSAKLEEDFGGDPKLIQQLEVPKVFTKIEIYCETINRIKGLTKVFPKF